MFCEHCPICKSGGACICCGYDGTRPVDRVAEIRSQIAHHREVVAQLEDELAAELQRQGRRPGDGSDQPSLFECERQPSLFGG